MQSLAIEWLNESALEDALIHEWTDLIERSSDAALFQTPEWALCWWRHFGSGELRLLTVRRGELLVALVPLILKSESRNGLPCRALRFVGDPESDHSGVLSDSQFPEALDAAVSAILEATRTADIVQLEELGADSASDRAVLAATSKLKRTALRTVCGRAPVLTLEGTLEELEATYGKSLRTRLKRARKRHAKLGNLEFRRWQPSASEVPELLEKLRVVEAAKVEARRVNGAPIDGVLTTPARWPFFLEVAKLFAEREWLDVATLAMPDHLIAYRLGFRFRGVFLDYNLAHDPEFSSLSPGRVLLDEIIRDSHRLGMRAVDASRGSLQDPHLLDEWPSNARSHVRWILTGPSIMGRSLGLIERHLKPAWRSFRARSESKD